MTVTRTTTTTTTVPNNETRGDQGLETTKTTTAAPPNELTTTPASVDFQQDGLQGNLVLAYLQRHGMPQGLTTSLANGYSLNTPDVSTTFNAPLTNEPNSKISGEFNPIRINPYFSDFASLPATTITHGMWSSAATHCYVESIVARGRPDRMIV